MSGEHGAGNSIQTSFKLLLSPSNNGMSSLLFSSVISLLLTNIVSPVRACLSLWLERFRGTQMKTRRAMASYYIIPLSGHSKETASATFVRNWSSVCPQLCRHKNCARSFSDKQSWVSGKKAAKDIWQLRRRILENKRTDNVWIAFANVCFNNKNVAGNLR
jgi:hypothetical protein